MNRNQDSRMMPGMIREADGRRPIEPVRDDR
ncbi:hypothetical protein SAOR_07050 [Salinisphaera orenii MK-B5]|uniref:Uncharacterized protein n=1 Tax=Salinisphaera orenii MK-B5 TaxID=856730 RepID=A0A423PQG0_9GAMM|nr:hypothetical protein SAOR_07050 [Salinisphaera orenii MK-B5]